VYKSHLICVRTDARQVLGFAEALRRAERYIRAGAEAIFVEAPESVAELEQLGKSFDVPQFANPLVGGRTPILTPKEFELLQYLSAHEDKALTHRAILNAVWGGQSLENVEYLRVFVNTLRKKVGAPYIVTEPWVGYRFRSRFEESG